MVNLAEHLHSLEQALGCIIGRTDNETREFINLVRKNLSTCTQQAENMEEELIKTTQILEVLNDKAY